MPGRVWRALADSNRAAWVRPAASLVVPGTGQLLGRRDRGVAYLAAEVYFLTRYVALSREGRREADSYRELAFRVARASFVSQRRDTVFEYYETMQRFRSSGSYDDDPGPLFLPETDPTTYNGSIWLLARRTYWANPDSAPPTNSDAYQTALAFYRTRAVGPDFVWSWQDADLERQTFAQSIRRSDDAFRRAGIQLGLLLANHVASAVDAFVSQRLSRALRTPATVHTWLDAGPRGSEVGVLLSLAVRSPRAPP